MDNQEQFKQQSLERGVAFQELTRTKGWGFIKLYFENKVKSFVTSLLVENRPMSAYSRERSELVGLKKLLGFVDNDIKTLENESKKDTGAAKE